MISNFIYICYSSATSQFHGEGCRVLRQG
jgi:hypothetical protein